MKKKLKTNWLRINAMKNEKTLMHSGTIAGGYSNKNPILMSNALENVLVCGADVNPDTIGINSLMG
jgi:hypothetical protein